MPFFVRWFSGRPDVSVTFFTLNIVCPCRIIKYRLRSCERSPNSTTLPTASPCPHVSHRHIGNGVPQYRSRENAQSFTCESHSPKRPSFICSGTQLTFLFRFTSSSFSDDI